MFSHEIYMQQCLDLAQKGRGFVSPNPMVGAIIVLNGEILAEGYHEKHGGKHAEVNALAKASGQLDQAVLYCNLEPCSHSGNGKINPPCTDAIIASGIGHVVIGSLDPNPRVSGRGIAALIAAGLDVRVGVLKDACDELNRVFFHTIQKNRPFISLKMAQTLDGFVATKTGESQWITDEKAREEVHRLRSEYDAILTTSATILADNPSLTVRHVKGRNPHRLLIDRYQRIKPDATIFNVDAKTTSFVYSSAKKNQIEIPEQATDEQWLKNVFAFVYENLNVQSILIECGPTFGSFLLGKKLIDELIVFVAPKILGDGKKVFLGQRVTDEEREKLKNLVKTI